MSNSFGLEIQGPQLISGNGQTTFNFSGDVYAKGGYMYGFSQLNLYAGTLEQDTYEISLNDSLSGNSVTVNQLLTGFDNSKSASYVTCVAVVGANSPSNLGLFNNQTATIGAPKTLTTPAASPWLAVAALSGFNLSFSKTSNLDGIGASVGVAMNPSDGSLGIIGTASLIGDEVGIEPTSSVSGSALVVTKNSDEINVYFQQAMETEDWLWQYVMWNANYLGVFLQSFYLQQVIQAGGSTLPFLGLSVGGHNFSLQDNNGNPGFSSGEIQFNSEFYTGGSPNTIPAQYQVANYLLLGMT